MLDEPQAPEVVEEPLVANGADADEPVDGAPVPTMDEALGTEGAEGEAATEASA